MDDDGQYVTQNVTFTITGTNDAPTITGGADRCNAARSPRTQATPRERHRARSPSTTVDLIDVHTTSVSPAAGNTLGGTLTMAR
jgi:hypothetical protein